MVCPRSVEAEDVDSTSPALHGGGETSRARASGGGGHLKLAWRARAVASSLMRGLWPLGSHCLQLTAAALACDPSRGVIRAAAGLWPLLSSFWLRRAARSFLLEAVQRGAEAHALELLCALDAVRGIPAPPPAAPALRRQRGRCARQRRPACRADLGG